MALSGNLFVISGHCETAMNLLRKPPPPLVSIINLPVTAVDAAVAETSKMAVKGSVSDEQARSQIQKLSGAAMTLWSEIRKRHEDLCRSETNPSLEVETCDCQLNRCFEKLNQALELASKHQG